MADAWVDVTPPRGYEWEGVPSGPLLAEVVAGVEPGALDAAGRVSFAQACDRLASWTQGQAAYALESAAHAVVRLNGGEDDTGFVDSRAAGWAVDELAAALHVAPSTVARRLRAAEVICGSQRSLWKAVNAGDVTWAQAVVIAECVSGLTVDADTDVEAVMTDVVSGVLATAGAYPPARLRTRVRHFLARAYPQAEAKRRRRAQREITGCSVLDEGQGMATLGITGPVVDITALSSIIDSRAECLRDLHRQLSLETTTDTSPTDSSDEDVERTWGQWQVSAILDAVGLAPMMFAPSPVDAHRPDGSRAIADVRVDVVVDLPTALGLAEEPGQLRGLGPIDPDLARFLAASGEWVRWVRDPIAGHLLDEGRRRFPSAGLARFIKARDARCDAPSCSLTSKLDVDHTPAWVLTQRTKSDLLSAACARHNRSRSRYGWTTPAPKTWMTATGRTYHTLMHQVLPIADDPPDDDPLPF